MKLLAIDTSAHLCSACVYDATNSIILSEASADIGRGHAEILIGQIEHCLSEASLSYSDLDRIAVARGPGSFTGVRVGVATARALALGLEISAIGISCLDACETYAAQLSQKQRSVISVLDAKRGEFYCKHPEWAEPRLLSLGDLVTAIKDAKLPICGSGANALAEAGDFDVEIVHTRAAMPGAVYARLAAQVENDEKPPEPLYMRSADAKPQSGFILPRREG